jgi:hypothetical protein
MLSPARIEAYIGGLVPAPPPQPDTPALRVSTIRAPPPRLQAVDPVRPPAACSKSFLVLFFKKEQLPSFP